MGFFGGGNTDARLNSQYIEEIMRLQRLEVEWRNQSEEKKKGNSTVRAILCEGKER